MWNILLMCSRYIDKLSHNYITFLNYVRYAQQVMYFNITIHQIGLSLLKAAESKMSNPHDQACVLEKRQMLYDPELHLREDRKTRAIKSKPELFKD